MNTVSSLGEIRLQDGDALLLVDIQNDFLPGGALPVPEGDRVVPAANGYIGKFLQCDLPVYASRDWHPPDHGSFAAHGGPWPPHCIAGSEGAEFPVGLLLPETAQIVSKGTDKATDGYSAFDETALHSHLEHARVRRLFVGGLATDYCVLNTVRDALEYGYRVYLLQDAMRAVNVNPEDGGNAEREMLTDGAELLTLDMLA
jgi:nicotinamidase/pyrazinamidase